MAIIHRLCDSAQTAGTLVDFTANLKPQPGSWQFSTSGDGLSASTFTAACKGDDATVMAVVQKLNELQEQCRLYWTATTYRAPVWYELSATDEGVKRGLVYEIGMVPVNESTLTPTLGVSGAKFNISIVYLDEWEDRVGTTIIPNTPTTVSGLGGSYTIGAISGSYPARINLMQFSGGPTATLYKIWCGIRPTGEGVSSFRPVWELESGTNGTDTATYTDYGGPAAQNAGPGFADNSKRCTFATATMVNRVSMTVQQAWADTNYNHAAGRYNVLLRCRLDATGECTARMYSGYGSTLAPAEYKPITWTNYKLLSLGEITIPPSGNFADTWTDTAFYPTFKVAVYAERNSGTPNLIMDCLVLIPTDHYTTNVGSAIGAGGYTNHYVFEDGTHGGLSIDSSDNPNAGLEIGMSGWELPISGGLLVVAAEESTAQIRADTVNLFMSANHRHRTFND